MNPTFTSVPFSADSKHGLAEYNGVAKFSPAGIIIEFESKLFGLVGGEVKEVRVGLNEILDIKFRRGIYKFFSRIQLRTKNFAKLTELPNDGGKVNLKIKREDFECARKAVEQTLQFMSGSGLKTLPEKSDANEQLPPIQTSVNELFDTERLAVKPTATNKD